MNTPIAPPTLAPPAANYSHAILSSGVTRLLHTSGVVPIALDGSVAESIDDQAVQVWANLSAILAEADMLVTDVVSVTTYVVVGELGELATVMAARDRALGGHRAASTLVTVPALARPEWKMEIALVAAA
ncbi:MAG: RidA family protein [Ilumatobacteraceae bacterium]